MRKIIILLFAIAFMVGCNTPPRHIEQPKQPETTKQKTAQEWYDKGIDLTRNGEYEEALKAYEKTIELRPDDTEVWKHKSIVLI